MEVSYPVSEFITTRRLARGATHPELFCVSAENRNVGHMSSRLQPHRSVKAVLSYYEDAQESGGDRDSDGDPGCSTPNPRRGKIKSERSGCETKQTRRRRSGKLSKFPAMPLDVMYEVRSLVFHQGSCSLFWSFQIFSLLHPRDLLRVSWTTKAFRGVLTDRSSKPIWKSSLASVDELPPCPPDLPEPAYAALLFSPYCSVSNRLQSVLTWTDGSKCYRDARNHGRLWSGNSGGGFVKRVLRIRKSHNQLR